MRFAPLASSSKNPGRAHSVVANLVDPRLVAVGFDYPANSGHPAPVGRWAGSIDSAVRIPLRRAPLPAPLSPLHQVVSSLLVPPVLIAFLRTYQSNRHASSGNLVIPARYTRTDALSTSAFFQMVMKVIRTVKTV